MAFDIEMIKQVYNRLPERVDFARKLTGKPLTATEKILYSHLWESTIEKPFIIVDNTTRSSAANTITFKVTGQTGILIPTGGTVLCFHNGTDIVSSGFPSTTGAQPAYTLPAADGTANQALITNCSGVVSFGSAGVSTGKAIAMAMIFG